MLLKSFSKYGYEVGTDEAGRGCLAGPVTAAAIYIDHQLHTDLINDSKKLTINSSAVLRSFIESNSSHFSIAHIFEDTMEEKEMINATIKAKYHAISQLKFETEIITVNENRFKPYKQIPYEAIVKENAKYLSIVAASIFAKTCRDGD